MQTDRDRLIELIEKEVPRPKADAIAYNLLANGAILPPCKVGDKVYTIFEGEIETLKITYIETAENKAGISRFYDAGNWNLKMPFADCHIGKSIFLTKEEAEAKLKECEKNDT